MIIFFNQENANKKQNMIIYVYAWLFFKKKKYDYMYLMKYLGYFFYLAFQRFTLQAGRDFYLKLNALYIYIWDELQSQKELVACW